ncbi:MAG: DNA polymerase, partial [Stenotrophomonas sp.]
VALYFSRYPGVRDFMERMRQQARDQGYVETLEGRRLYLNDIHARNQGLRAGAERAAINAPMQGTAADIIKRAMVKVDGWLQGQGDQARMIMQVHDELVFETESEFLDTLRLKVVELMSSSAQLRVPLVVDAGVGDNWDEAH